MIYGCDNAMKLESRNKFIEFHQADPHISRDVYRSSQTLQDLAVKLCQVQGLKLSTAATPSIAILWENHVPPSFRIVKRSGLQTHLHLAPGPGAKGLGGWHLRRLCQSCFSHQPFCCWKTIKYAPNCKKVHQSVLHGC